MGLTSKAATFQRASSDPDRIERLMYLADLISELQQLAVREDCDTLARLLGLAHLEAFSKAGRLPMK